jgi:hypothetical protein
MDMHDEAFPYLSHFLGGYMNQDWDISGHGKTLEEVVAYYVKVGDPDEAHGLKMDIKRFVASKGNDIDREFERLFRPEIIPSGWGMSTREWLQWIERLVGEELRKRAPEGG